MTQKWKFVMGRVENIVGERENTCYQHFLLLPQRFSKLSLPDMPILGSSNSVANKDMMSKI